MNPFIQSGGGGVSASTTAGAVSFSPSGNVAATNVQTAIEELDTEKSATSHTHSNATTSVAGFMSSSDKTKLDSVATGATAYTDTLARSAVIASSISDGDTTHAPDGNSVYDALATKAPNILTGFTSGAGTVAATDSVLQAIQKLDGNISAIDGGTGLFEIDVDGGLMPVTDNLSDAYYELDGNSDIMPIAA